MELTVTEAKMLSDASTALYYLHEEEPTIYSQSMARQYVEDIQKALLQKQSQKSDEWMTIGLPGGGN